MAKKNPSYKSIEEFDSTKGIEIVKKDEEDIVGYVLDRFRYLYSLKSHRYPKYWKYRDEYSNMGSVSNSED
jgi:hypothetical protein